ncbi:hypothetical protein RFI_18579 [Reticulomyxa filosa]|uniref:Uncharacterized protein n=1 Tax=Reticulomyxa filosa TaxID=46433 RepID=X6MXV7_RETFI|nr:hypothetical protein RFI_18579 [Reticulomyxa filosa]|eukprot:ETO18676.1 hypothetical protein RFI_18579 [Reticulomyxa filosa]
MAKGLIVKKTKKKERVVETMVTTFPKKQRIKTKTNKSKNRNKTNKDIFCIFSFQHSDKLKHTQKKRINKAFFLLYLNNPKKTKSMTSKKRQK